MTRAALFMVAATCYVGALCVALQNPIFGGASMVASALFCIAAVLAEAPQEE